MKRFTKSALIIGILTILCSAGLFAESRPSRPTPRHETRVEIHKRPSRKRVKKCDRHHHHHHHSSSIEFHFPLIDLGDLLDIDIECYNDDLYDLYDLFDLEDEITEKQEKSEGNKPTIIQGNIDIRIGL